MVDLGPSSDCCASEPQTESQTGTNIETKVSLAGEINEKGGVKTHESSVQPSMTKTCDIDIVEQGSSAQQEIKDNRNVEPGSSGEHHQQGIDEKAEDEQEFLVQEEIKEKQDALKESSVEDIQKEIKKKVRILMG